MDIFRYDGHLTDEALAALVTGESLDETARLEMAEHLAFCDLCLQRYTDALTGTELLTPEHSCRESLLRRIRARAARLFLNRYATAAAAVALALTMLWGSAGVTLPERIPLPEDRPTVSDGLRKWNESLDSAMSGLNDFFDGLGQWTPSAQGGN
ncbi:hypothetical protein [Dysosmobacter sp.]|uniref:hypothetical protein n=1 Tax=Dysosmobacter sp. TaxID=2591382 RepID=UPI002AA02C24|nr:hypothetical protein [Dysosmobacter sp.]MDY5613491.1 hypothetical protein [Dysosmobacter sp.]